MKFFKISSDGGKNSGVKGLFVIEIKNLFSIVLLKFSPNNRENFHSHAFNALTFWLKGEVEEEFPNGQRKSWFASLIPKFTPKSNIHKIHCKKPAYAISFRGAWENTWKEYNPTTGEYITLTSGRKVVPNE